MNRNALITGASRRIGKAIAEHLAGMGWSLIIHYNRSAGEAPALAKELSERYPAQKFAILKADLSVTDELETLVARSIRELGDLELLINNASVFDPGTIAATSADLFDFQIRVNLRAPFLLMRDFRNLCKQGNIINLADTRITGNQSGYAAYTLSKKALWELTRMAALEFAPDIRVNAIAPGVTLPSAYQEEEDFLRMAERIPMKRPGGLEPILKSLDFILDNDHLTGQLLFADGGENLGSNR
jgi:pteridine reductase